MIIDKQKVLNRTCPICGFRSGETLRKIEMIKLNHIPIDTEYDVVKCENCGFCYADVSSKQNQYNLYYQNANIYSASARLKENIISQICKVRYEVFEKYVEKNARILDIGCGDGAFLRYLKERGYSNIYGIDPSGESIRCLEENGISGEIGNIFGEVPNRLKNKYDVVTCTAVMEHIYELKSALSQMGLYLSQTKGRIFIEAPAVEGFEKYIFPVANYFNQEHINYFSIVSLDNLFVENGYKRISKKEEAYKTITENENQKELSLCVLYQRTGEKGNIVQDTISENSIKNYFKIIDAKNNDMHNKIKEIAALHEKIVVWGTGSYTLQMLKEIPELERHIAYFVDNNELKQGKKIEDIMVYSPQQLLHDDKCSFILICSMMNGRDIADQISAMKLKNQYYIVGC